jgi:NTP pyrophosphatase (non-canonical NTP hydrolase)
LTYAKRIARLILRVLRLSIDWEACSVIIRGNSRSPVNKPSSPREHDMDLQALQVTLRDFAAARHWQPFHTPKNLSTALIVEAAELAEIFQWMTPEESQRAHITAAVKERIADEVADVLLYLLQLADHCDIDLPQAVASKLVKNAIKHPIAPDIAPLNSGQRAAPGLYEIESRL